MPEPIRQAGEACPKCGSFYRRGDNCNICATHAPWQDVSDVQFKEGKSARGAGWDSKQHKVIWR